MHSIPPLAALVRRVAPELEAVSDVELLERFVRSADQAAFELLVWRHGAMVWGVCCRALVPDRDAAEDACQAVFVALASHAARLRDRRALAAWLHRVAVRAALALVAERKTLRLFPPDEPDPVVRSWDPARAASAREVRALLDTGLNRLPEKLRVPFVLCELEGRSNAEAAAALGCPLGTIESRLVRARKRLRIWLVDRGVVPGAVALAVAVPESAWAAMGRGGAAGPVAPAVRALAARALPRAVLTNVRTVSALGLVLALSAAGFALATGKRPETPTAPAPERVADTPPGKSGDEKPPGAGRKEIPGFPLPVGAVARLGSPLLRHPGAVHDVRFSPDGKRIASVGEDAIRIWNAETGEQLVALDGTGLGANKVAFADAGKTLVVAGRPARSGIQVWRIDAQSGRAVKKFTLPEKPGTLALPYCFSSDGGRLALAVLDSEFKTKQLVVTDPATENEVWARDFEGASAIAQIAFSGDGRTLAVSTFDGVLRCYDAASGKAAEVLKADGAPFAPATRNFPELRVLRFALSPDGRSVVASEAKTGLVCWDRASGKRLWGDKSAPYFHLAFTPDGGALICAGAEGARVLDPATGKKLVPANGVAVRDEDLFVLRPDGKVGAVCRDGAISSTDLATGRLVGPGADPPCKIGGVWFSPDGKTLFGQDHDPFDFYGPGSDAFAWNLATGARSGRTSALWYHHDAFSRDGTLAVGYHKTDRGWRLEVCDTATRAVLHSYAGPEYDRVGRDGSSEGASVARFVFTPDARAVIGWNRGDTIYVWATDTGKELFRAPARLRHYWETLAFSADGRVMVAASSALLEAGQPKNPREDDSVRVWDLKTGAELAQLSPGTRVRGLAASADGRRVAALAFDTRRYTATPTEGYELEENPGELALVWEVPSAKPEGAVPGKTVARIFPVGEGREGAQVALSGDGRLLALTALGGSVVRVYEVSSGTERFTFRHQKAVTGLAFAPEGRVLAAASAEAPVYLWDLTGAGGAEKLPAWDARGAEALWDRLGSTSASGAFAAMRALRAHPEEALAFLKDRVPLGPDERTLRALFADLGSEDFATREKATKALAGYGESVRAALAAELARSESAEARARLVELLKRSKPPAAPAPDRVRLIRAVEVVEGIGTPGARALLEVWAASPGAPLAPEARDAIRRRAR
jgi:RNA polymerase sigma factor (sigma-70 family)